MKKKTTITRQLLFHIAVNTCIVLFITGASYFHTPLNGGKDTLFYLAHLFLLQSTVAGGVYILSLFRWLFYIVFPLLFVPLSALAYWMYTQDVSITSGLLQAVIETKPDIAVDLITWPYVLYIVASIVVVIFILKGYKTLLTRRRLLLWLPIALACIALYFVVESKRHNTFKSRLPYNVYQGISTYLETPDLVLNKGPFTIENTTDSLKVIFVLGETVRADHLSINGYHRNTTPLLRSRGDVISLQNVFTSNTYTATSIPQILTDKNLNEVKDSYTSIYSLANAASIKTTWIGNQTLESSFGPIVHTNSDVVLIDSFKSEYSFNKELDEAMLPVLDSVLATHTNQFITLHMMGSHWYYENRYPDTYKKYTPVIDSKYIPSLSQEQMINSYDNTLLYLDHFLNRIITSLEQDKVPSVLVYVSDHGEYLGEDGKYLHAGGGDVLKNPAILVWFSNKYNTSYPAISKEIKDKQNAALTTNEVFPMLKRLLLLR